jgi:hypothetical protein
MSLFDRFRSAGRVRAGGSERPADASEDDALRLIDEGNAIEQQGRLAEAMQRYEAAIRLALQSNPQLRAADSQISRWAVRSRSLNSAVTPSITNGTREQARNWRST